MRDDPPAPLSVDPPRPPAAGVLDAAARHDRRLFESLNEGIWERDLRTGEVWYSPRYKALLGFRDDELPNLIDAVRDRVHADDVAGVQAAYAQAERDGVGEAQGRIRVVDGSYRWFRGRFRIWPDAEGRPATLVGALYDVHDQVVATEALQAQHAVLEQRVLERTQRLEAALQLADAQRLEAERANRTKASFLAHMSHELRTPLNGVLGMTQLAQALALNAEQRRYLELAQQAGQTLLGFLDDVLDFARGEAGRLQLRDAPFDLAELAAETLRSFMPSVRRKGLDVGFDYVGDISAVRGDAARVRQIISNLLGNAIKYTERGHVLLIVAVDADADDPQRCRVRLRVRDTGIGMDADTAARVFEPFEQGESGSDRRHGGSGLGLSVVQVLARLMGGEVSVRSQPLLGSEFRVELKLAADAEQPLRALAETTPRRGHSWVLMRDAGLAAGASQRLARLGGTSRVLGSVPAAIDTLVRRDGAPPDYVLIAEDAIGPDTDFATLRRHLRPGVPVTLLLRPDFDLSTVHAATERWEMRICVAPLTPADLHAVRRRDAAPLAPAALESALPASGRPANVLVVEDNLLNQIIAREMVAALGLRPAVVGSGEEAMASCQSTPPDLVLMDIQMPGMDGLETTRRLRALQAAGELRPFPIIALTAHAMASDRQASLAAGMDEHLTKPVQLEHLRRVLRHWLDT